MEGWKDGKMERWKDGKRCYKLRVVKNHFGGVVENVHFFRGSIKQTSKVSYGNKGCRVQGVGGREKRKRSKDQEGCGLQDG